MDKIEGIKNVVFDLGGVIIDLRRENAVEALEALGVADADSMLGLYRQEGPFLGIETGKLTPADFFDRLRGYPRKPPPFCPISRNLLVLL